MYSHVKCADNDAASTIHDNTNKPLVITQYNAGAPPLQLATINERMGEFSGAGGGAVPSAAVTHTLQRHRDILHDYTHEFGRTKTALDASRDRRELLGRATGDDRSV